MKEDVAHNRYAMELLSQLPRVTSALALNVQSLTLFWKLSTQQLYSA